MSPFEYVSVLISIILGLGITLVLSGIAQLISRWNAVTPFWPYLVWVVLVFVLHVHEWWIMYDLRTMERWSLLTFLFLILYPILLFILANLLFPGKWSKKNLHLKNFYFRMYPKFFLCALVLILLAVLSDVFIAGRLFQEQIIKIFLFVLILTLYFIKPGKAAVHGIVALLFLSMMIISMILLSDELVIR
jgi:hypothetical protein